MAEFSPMMQQYLKIKEQYKDTIIFYRLGDFYEMFFEDAITASRELEITLTGRECGQAERAPMCGVPYHAVQTYIEKLSSKGYKIAIVDQMEEASNKKIVDKLGNDAINNPLSVKRANAVADFLKIQGIAANRIVANGFGSANPIASNATASGREQNRRVEIKIIPCHAIIKNRLPKF